MYLAGNTANQSSINLIVLADCRRLFCTLIFLSLLETIVLVVPKSFVITFLWTEDIKTLFHKKWWQFYGKFWI